VFNNFLRARWKLAEIIPSYHILTGEYPFESWCAKFAHFWCFLANPRARGQACATTRKVLGPRKIFSLPARTNEDRRCIRRFVCLDSARLTRIYGMLASTEFREERSAIFAHDSSPGGVRLSGGNRTFLDVTRSVRCPSRGEELWKNTQNTLPTFWPASRAIWPRWGRFQGVFLLGYFAFRVAHRDNGCSHKVGPVRNSYASMLGNRSRTFVVIGWPVSMRARFVECGASCKLTRLFFFFRRKLDQSMFGTDEKMYVGGPNYGHRLIWPLRTLSGR
jgi:hypothetical protein